MPTLLEALPHALPNTSANTPPQTLPRALRAAPRHGGRVLLTGGTGYLGALLAAQMLHDGWADHLLLPTRRPMPADGLPTEVQAELQALGADPDAHRHQLQALPWRGAETATTEDLRAMLAQGRIDTIVHCAGCLDYFDTTALTTLNVDFTSRLAEAARQAGVGCLVFVSTAYAGGYSDAPIPEAALAEPRQDPTCYTQTKRAAEHIVAGSGLPFVIVRPSIVVGNARDGRYSGKRYGLYQQWMGIERLLCDRYHRELHTVATDQPVNLLHQDTFQAAMAGVLRWVPDGAHVNLVARDEVAPSMKDLWRMACEVTRPQSVVFYDSLRQVHLKSLDIRQRSYLTFARTNLEIGAYAWRFERAWLALLHQRGLPCTDTTLATLQVCQDRFMRASPTMQAYLERFADEFPAEVAYRDVGDVCDVGDTAGTGSGAVHARA